MAGNALQTLHGKNDQNYIVRSSLTSYYSKSIAQNYSIKNVQDGIENYVLDGKQIRLAAGQFLVVNPGQSVEVEIETAKNVNGRCFFIEPELLSKIHYGLLKSDAWNIENQDFQQHQLEVGNFPINGFGTFPNKYFNDYKLDQLCHRNQVSDYLILLGESLIAQQLDQFQTLNVLDNASLKTKNEIFRRIQIGRSFIHESFKEDISLKDIAQAGNLSTYHFHRCFRAYFKQTPHQYLFELRMQTADDLLKNERLSASQAAFQIGFSDPKYFRKVYKKWVANASSN